MSARGRGRGNIKSSEKTVDNFSSYRNKILNNNKTNKSTSGEFLHHHLQDDNANAFPIEEDDDASVTDSMIESVIAKERKTLSLSEISDPGPCTKKRKKRK